MVLYPPDLPDAALRISVEQFLTVSLVAQQISRTQLQRMNSTMLAYSSMKDSIAGKTEEPTGMPIGSRRKGLL